MKLSTNSVKEIRTPETSYDIVALKLPLMHLILPDRSNRDVNSFSAQSRLIQLLQYHPETKVTFIALYWLGLIHR